MDRVIEKIVPSIQRTLLDRCKSPNNKTPLETIRYRAATHRSLNIDSLPPILYHESGDGAGNYLYGKITYTLPDSAYRNGPALQGLSSLSNEHDIWIFAHGIVQVTRDQWRPGVVFLVNPDKGDNVPELVLYVPDAPLASMESELFEIRVSDFEEALFGTDDAKQRVKCRVMVGYNIREYSDFEMLPNAIRGYHLKREGALPFMRLRVAQNAEERMAEAATLHAIHQKLDARFWSDSLDHPMNEWFEQKRVSTGLELITLFDTERLEFEELSMDNLEETVVDGYGVEGSIPRVMSIILLGARDATKLDPEFCSFVSTDTPDRDFQKLVDRCAKDEVNLGKMLHVDMKSGVAAALPQFSSNSVCGSMSAILKHTRSEAITKLLHRGPEEPTLVKAFLAEYAENPRAVSEFEGDSVWKCCVEVASKMKSPNSAILCICIDKGDGLCCDVRIATKKSCHCDVAYDEIVRLLQLPWVYPLLVEQDVGYTVSLKNVVRKPLRLEGAMPVSVDPPSLPEESATSANVSVVTEMRHELGRLKDEVDRLKTVGPVAASAETSSAPAASSVPPSWGTSTLSALHALKRSLVEYETKVEAKKAKAT